MKFTNTEVEDLLESIMFSINYCREGHDDPESALKDIEETCKDFKDKYCCPYKKYTAEWYDEHGE